MFVLIIVILIKKKLSDDVKFSFITKCFIITLAYYRAYCPIIKEI